MPTAAQSPTAVQGAQSFSRSIAVLQLIADAGTALSRAEIAARCGLTRPTLYRIIASLEAEGLIEPTGENRYCLGGRLVSLARTALAENDVRRLAEPVLARLRDTTRETVHLAIRSGDALVYIDKFESQEAVRMASTVGTRVPFHSSGVGKAFMAAMSEPEAAALIDRLDLPAITAHTTTDRAALQVIVRQARADGHVCDDQENEIGIVCFGAAIRERPDRPVASVSVSVPLFRLGEAGAYSEPLMAAVSAISARLGYRGA